jgi:hypothetical protein
MKTLKIFRFIGFGILGLGFIFLAVFITMSLWNWLVPSLFNGPELNFWQTAGLFLLSKILLTGISPGKHHDYRYKNDWRKKYHEKYHKQFTEGKENETLPEV